MHGGCFELEQVIVATALALVYVPKLWLCERQKIRIPGRFAMRHLQNTRLCMSEMAATGA